MCGDVLGAKEKEVKVAIVCTGIHDSSEVLEGYWRNIKKYGHENDVLTYFIPDVKTPNFVIPPNVFCPDLNEQDKFLEKVGFPSEDIPRNSDNRRNVGYLMALRDGADIVISIDDDNYCLPGVDFVGTHVSAIRDKVSSSHLQLDRVSTSRWFNNCSLLWPTVGHPRGFPYFARENCSTWNVAHEDNKLEVCINEGLWLGDADLDAISWIAGPKKVTRHQPPASIVLGEDSWCPINSQNTAVRRDAMAAYYFVLDPRFGDIFGGYFALKCAKRLGLTARFGTPLVEHKRNTHHYLSDAQREIDSIVMLEKLLPSLLEYRLSGSSFGDAYLCLADFIAEQGAVWYVETARLMRQWAKSCRIIG